jgi:uncharacterized RDD family membrane protein YckC
VLAFVADTVVVVGVVAAVVRRLTPSRLRRLVAGSVAATVGGLVYHVALEGTSGQTVGKRLSGVVVVREDGGQCTYSAAAIRTLFRFVDWLPAGYLLGLVAIALTDRGQRLGDLAAGTAVVRAGSVRSAVPRLVHRP